MVSYYISVVEARLCHDAVVFRIDGVVPSHDVAEADAECVVSVHSLHELRHVVSLLCQVCKFASLADLRVCDHDDIVVGVILGVLLNYKLILLYVFFDLLVEKGLAAERR